MQDQLGLAQQAYQQREEEIAELHKEIKHRVRLLLFPSLSFFSCLVRVLVLIFSFSFLSNFHSSDFSFSFRCVHAGCKNPQIEEGNQRVTRSSCSCFAASSPNHSVWLYAPCPLRCWTHSCGMLWLQFEIDQETTIDKEGTRKRVWISHLSLLFSFHSPMSLLPCVQSFSLILSSLFPRSFSCVSILSPSFPTFFAFRLPLFFASFRP